MARAWPTPCTMPPSCARLTTNITSQYQSIQWTRQRRPGSSLIASMAVRPDVTV